MKLCTLYKFDGPDKLIIMGHMTREEELAHEANGYKNLSRIKQEKELARLRGEAV